MQRACSRLPGAATHHRLVDAWGNGNHQVGGYCVSHVCACEERRRPRPIGERCTETRPANPRLHCRRARGWHRRRCHQRRVLGRVPRCPRCAGSGYCDNLRPAFPAFRRHADWLHGRGRVLDERLRRPAAQGRLPGLRRLRRSPYRPVGNVPVGRVRSAPDSVVHVRCVGLAAEGNPEARSVGCGDSAGLHGKGLSCSGDHRWPDLVLLPADPQVDLAAGLPGTGAVHDDPSCPGWALCLGR